MVLTYVDCVDEKQLDAADCGRGYAGEVQQDVQWGPEQAPDNVLWGWADWGAE